MHKPMMPVRVRCLPLPWLMALALLLPGCGDDDAPATLEQVRTEYTGYLDDPAPGDWDAIRQRGFLRILTVHNPLYFQFDGAERHGLTVEMARLLGEHLNSRIGRVRAPSVVIIPVARNELFTALNEGRGDIVAANVAITQARAVNVDFTLPVIANVDELLVTGPALADITSLDDLKRTPVYVRKSSSYFEHLEALNAQRAEQGQRQIRVREADEYLEDADLLDLVNAGVYRATIIDSFKARLWASAFPAVTIHEDIAIQRGTDIGWAIRKDSPQLKALLDEFIASVRAGTLLGNVVLERYDDGSAILERALSADHQTRFEGLVPLFQRYADQYDFNWLMIAAQGYQESQFNQAKRSPAGAVGVMQLLPTTAADPNIGINDISTVENNIHAGVKYLDFLRERYFNDEAVAPLDRTLFALAAYNAGPRSVARARQRAASLGFDPNLWFGNVEIGMYRAVSGEPVSYVRNVYKYYVSLQYLERARDARERAIERARD